MLFLGNLQIEFDLILLLVTMDSSMVMRGGNRNPISKGDLKRKITRCMVGHLQ
jgi:hypothetical protein